MDNITISPTNSCSVSDNTSGPITSHDPYLDAITIINKYFEPIMVLGIPANILVILVFSLNDMSGSTTSLLFRILAFFDMLVVIINIALHNIPRLATGRSLIAFSNTTCKVFEFIFFSARSMSSWTLVMIGMERAIGMTWPHKARDICSRSRFSKGVILMVTIITILFCPLLVSTELGLRIQTGEYICDIYAKLPVYGLVLFIYMEVTIATLAPLSIMLICNVIVIRALQKRTNVRRALTASGANSTGSHIAPMMLSASFAFMLLRLPEPIYIFMDKTYLSNWELYGFRVITFMAYLSVACDSLNHSINIFLYCLSGPRFRQRLVRMVLGVCCGCRVNETTGVSWMNATKEVYVSYIGSDTKLMSITLLMYDICQRWTVPRMFMVRFNERPTLDMYHTKRLIWTKVYKSPV